MRRRRRGVGVAASASCGPKTALVPRGRGGAEQAALGDGCLNSSAEPLGRASRAPSSAPL